jgi:hypothetical protein
MRLNIFRKNLEYIEQYNKKDTGMKRTAAARLVLLSAHFHHLMVLMRMS